MSGYEKFFKDARKAAQVRQGDSSSGRKPSIPLDGRAPDRKSKDQARAIGPNRKQTQARSQMTPEDRVRLELAERIQKKKMSATRKKQKFPVGAAISAVLIFAGSAYGFLNQDVLSEILGRVEIGVFGSASAAGPTDSSSRAEPGPKTGGGASARTRGGAQEINSESLSKNKPDQSKEENSSATDALPGEKVASSEDPEGRGRTPDLRSWSDEELSFFKTLNERKRELDRREKELIRMEEELQKQQAELEVKLKRLEETRTQISQALKTRVATDQQKVDKLVEFYSTMKAQQAAKVIESLNEDLAVEVLDKMKKKNAAEIMNAMDAKKARRLSELLTGYQRTPAGMVESEESKQEERGIEDSSSRENPNVDS